MDFGFKIGHGKPVIDPWELKKGKVLHGGKVILAFHPLLLTRAKTSLKMLRL